MAKHHWAHTLKKGLVISFITIGSLLLLAVVLLFGVLEIASSDRGLRQLETVANDFIDGSLHVAAVDYQFFSTFPDFTLSIDSVSVRYAVISPSDSLAISSDSLLNFDHFSMTVNLMRFLFTGDVVVKNFTLDHPQIVGVVNSKGIANWSLITSEPDTTPSESFSLPNVYVHQLSIKRGSVRYIDQQSGLSFAVDSLDVSANGEMLCDTFVVKSLLKSSHIRYAHANQMAVTLDHFNMEMATTLQGDSSRTTIGVRTPAVSYKVGTLYSHPLPLSADAVVKARNNFSLFDIEKFDVCFKTIQMHLHGTANQLAANAGWNTHLNFNLSIGDLQQVCELVPMPYALQFVDYQAAGTVDLSGKIQGVLNDTIIPKVEAHLAVFNVQLGMRSRTQKIDSFNLDADMCYDQSQPDSTFVILNAFDFKSGPSFMQAHGKVQNPDNPYADFVVKAQLDLGYVAQAFPLPYATELDGDVKADVKIHGYPNDVVKGFYDRLYALGNMQIQRISVQLPHHDFRLFATNVKLDLGSNSIASKRYKRNMLFSLRMDFDSLRVKYGKLIQSNASHVTFSSYADQIVSGIPVLRASLNMANAQATLNDTLYMKGQRTRLSFTVRADTIDTMIPRLKASLRVDSVVVNQPSFGTFLDSTRLEFTLKPRVRKTHRVNGVRVPIDMSNRKPMDLDSLYRLCMVVVDAEKPDEQFFKKFTMHGKTYMKVFRYSSPYFPLRTSIRRFDMEFTDDTLHLKNVRLRVGRSAVTLNGDMYNMRRAFLRGRTLEANFQIKSRRLDFNQILNAIYEGNELRKREAEDRRKLSNSNSGNSHLAQLTEDAVDNSSVDSDTLPLALIVIPKNLDLTFVSSIDTIRFGNMVMRDFKGDVRVKDHAMQIKKLTTTTDVGDLRMNMMYKCSVDTIAQTGLDIWTNDISIEDLVGSLPMLDSLLPMLRSFKGKVDGEVTTVANLDKRMNIILPSMNGAGILYGEKLVLLDGETFSEIAKMLMFKRKTENVIDKMSVELLVKNNQLQLLPFMLEMDKYRAAVSGVNDFDMNFKYHISVLQSPLPLKIGIDVTGNPDDWHVKLVQPLYKNEKSVTRYEELLKGTVNVRTELQKSLQKAILEVIETTKE